MDIQDKIVKQLNAGFTADEIRANLRTEGHTEEEIRRGLGTIPQDLAEINKATSPWRIILSVVLLIISLVRLFVACNK